MFELLGIAGITVSMLADLPQLIHLGQKHMPGVDGLRLADALRNDEQRRATPLIFLGAETRQANAERARALPATRAASAGHTVTVAS